MKPKIFLMVFIFITIITYLFIAAKSSPILMHYFHLVFPSRTNDIDKIIKEYDFDPSKKDYSVNFNIESLKVEFYEIRIEDRNESIPAKIEFNGIIKIVFSHKGEIIHSELIKDYESAIYKQKDIKFYKSLILYTFEYPFKGRKDNLEIQVTVIKPDTNIVKYSNKIKLSMVVSGMI